ncbi:hypothetical protein FQA39_LY03120 [Lamprigera yunnana]|nr:hypothetical protein FQA39_LY03120 [Lamprigera yunnana]
MLNTLNTKKPESVRQTFSNWLVKYNMKPSELDVDSPDWVPSQHLGHVCQATSKREDAVERNARVDMRIKLLADIEIYKTDGGVALSQKMTEKSRLLSLLQPQMEPIQSRFDSSANYIVKDRQTTNEFEDTAADDVEEIFDENNPPQHVQLSRKKET